MRLKITTAEAERYLASLPGARGMYQRLTKLLLDYYSASS